jgi:hypothetical protein
MGSGQTNREVVACPIWRSPATWASVSATLYLDTGTDLQLYEIIMRNELFLLLGLPLVWLVVAIVSNSPPADYPGCVALRQRRHRSPGRCTCLVSRLLQSFAVPVAFSRPIPIRLIARIRKALTPPQKRPIFSWDDKFLDCVATRVFPLLTSDRPFCPNGQRRPVFSTSGGLPLIQDDVRRGDGIALADGQENR